MKEIEIKKLVTHWITQSTPNPNTLAIGLEVKFKSGERRADIVTLSENVATCFEIKSSTDKTERLKHQIPDYLKYFDYCYVVCEESNLSEVKKSISKHTGIILTKESSIRIIREAKKSLKLSKPSLLSTLSHRTLQLYSHKKYRLKEEQIRHLAKKIDLNKARDISRKHMYENLHPATQIFLIEKSNSIHTDDLSNLSRPKFSRLSPPFRNS